MQFSDLRLAKPILRAIDDAGYTTATPIQARAIPPVLEGRDVLGCAQTGTGKTAAFALPTLNALAGQQAPKGQRLPRCLVLSPTRELAIQIAENFQAYSKHLDVRGAVIYGGVSQNPQVKKLQAGVDVLIATPGRLMDLMNQGHVNLSKMQVLVLDEADRMLDMGFINDIRKITAKVPKKRQTLLFSATMPKEIRGLANDLLRDPVSIEIAVDSPPADRINQAVYFVDKPNKMKLLTHLLNKLPVTRVIVFTRTKHGADKVCRLLRRAKFQADAIHGNKSQNARQRSLAAFRSNKIMILVATDIASRGIDVDEVSHVFNYDVSNDPESYVHRIGRTARAGCTGTAISLCDKEERAYLRDIEKLIGMEVPVKTDHPEDVPIGEAPKPGEKFKPKQRGARRQGPARKSSGTRQGQRKKKSARRGGAGGGGNPQGQSGGPRKKNRRNKPGGGARS
ncbi:MAG: DEAD/DEAH box helicase [Phycisphaerales bacterium JB063]